MHADNSIETILEGIYWFFHVVAQTKRWVVPTVIDHQFHIAAAPGGSLYPHGSLGFSGMVLYAVPRGAPM